MNITRKDVDALNAIITVDISQEDLAPKVEQVLKDYRKRADIPGFRKGNVPIGVIKKQSGHTCRIFLTYESFTAQDESEFKVRKAIQEKFTMGKAFSDSFVKYFGKGELNRDALKAWAAFQKKEGQTSGTNYSDAFKKIKNEHPDNLLAHLLYAISLYNKQEGSDYS